jgi:hypothetical protein
MKKKGSPKDVSADDCNDSVEDAGKDILRGVRFPFGRGTFGFSRLLEPPAARLSRALSSRTIGVDS